MKRFQVVIQDPMGIHARPAGKLTALAKQFTANITLIKNNQLIDLKSPLDMMRLAVKYGDCIIVEMDGVDEDLALMQLKDMFDQLM